MLDSSQGSSHAADGAELNGLWVPEPRPGILGRRFARRDRGSGFGAGVEDPEPGERVGPVPGHDFVDCVQEIERVDQLLRSDQRAAARVTRGVRREKRQIAELVERRLARLRERVTAREAHARDRVYVRFDGVVMPTLSMPLRTPAARRVSR